MARRTGPCLSWKRMVSPKCIFSRFLWHDGHTVGQTAIWQHRSVCCSTAGERLNRERHAEITILCLGLKCCSCQALIAKTPRAANWVIFVSFGAPLCLWHFQLEIGTLADVGPKFSTGIQLWGINEFLFLLSLSSLFSRFFCAKNPRIFAHREHDHHGLIA